MALLVPQQMSTVGPVITYGAVGASDTFAPVERGLLLYRTAGTISTLTFVIPGNSPFFGQLAPDVVQAFAATEARGFATKYFINAVDSVGLITVTSSSQTTFTVAYVITD